MVVHYSQNGICLSPPLHKLRARIHVQPEGTTQFLRRLWIKGGSVRSTLRAIPYPKVTELFCRLPSATLLYRLEAANLGDLLRLWVRAGVQIKHYRGFSGVAAIEPDAS